MGVDYSSYVILGVSLNDGLFKEIYEESRTFDEYDKKGNLTGKQFTEKYLMGIDYKNETHKLGEYKNNDRLVLSIHRWFEDTYSSKIIDVYCTDYESMLLDDFVIGKRVAHAGSYARDGVDKLAVSAEDIQEVKMEFSRKFNYNGPVYYYLIQNVSY